MYEWKVTLQDRVVQEFRVDDGQTLVVGRGAEADVVIDNTAVSRRHASVQVLNGACFVNDLGSTNGTRINNEVVTAPTTVEVGDVVTIGKFRLEPVAGAGQPANRPDIDTTVFVAPKAQGPRPVAARPPRLTVVQGNCHPAGCSTESRHSVTVGKGQHCDLQVKGWFIGSPQCRVEPAGGEFRLVPLGGVRRTTLNGAPLRGAAPLNRGDLIGVGGVRLRFE